MAGACHPSQMVHCRVLHSGVWCLGSGVESSVGILFLELLAILVMTFMLEFHVLMTKMFTGNYSLEKRATFLLLQKAR